MPDDVYKVSIKGPGFDLDREVPRELADRVLLLVVTGQAAATAQPPAKPAAGAPLGVVTGVVAKPPSDDISIQEFLIDSQAKRGPDKITAIAEYLRQYEKKPSFKLPDVLKGFEDAAESVPANVHRDFKWARKAGFVTESSTEKGAYRVTNTGQQAVAKRFSKDVVAKTKRTTGLPKKAKTQESA